MSAQTNAVQSAAMARRDELSTGTEQVNLRIPSDLRALLVKYSTRPLGPTMTAIIVQALREWFARNPLPDDAAPGGKAPARTKAEAAAAKGQGRP